jgi:hypothetical protein
MAREMTDRDADKLNQYLGAGTWERWHTLDVEGRPQLVKRKQIVGQRCTLSDHQRLPVEGCNGSVEASGQVIGLGSAWMHREWELCARAGAVGRAQASLVTCGEVVGGQSA